MRDLDSIIRDNARSYQPGEAVSIPGETLRALTTALAQAEASLRDILTFGLSPQQKANAVNIDLPAIERARRLGERAQAAPRAATEPAPTTDTAPAPQAAPEVWRPGSTLARLECIECRDEVIVVRAGDDPVSALVTLTFADELGSVEPTVVLTRESAEKALIFLQEGGVFRRVFSARSVVDSDQDVQICYEEFDDTVEVLVGTLTEGHRIYSGSVILRNGGRALADVLERALDATAP